MKYHFPNLIIMELFSEGPPPHARSMLLQSPTIQLWPSFSLLLFLAFYSHFPFHWAKRRFRGSLARYRDLGSVSSLLGFPPFTFSSIFPKPRPRAGPFINMGSNIQYDGLRTSRMPGPLPRASGQVVAIIAPGILGTIEDIKVVLCLCSS